jgi:predicted GNAT family N-acyltransferase
MRKLNEKPHITRLDGQWVIEYIRMDEMSAMRHEPLRIRRVICGNSMRRLQRAGRILVNNIGHYHQKIVAKKPRKY